MRKIFLLFVVFVIAISCSNKTENNNAMPNETQLTSNTITFEGDFVYYADSAIFSNYAEMKNYPVAMEGEYINLEREYTAFNFAEPTKVNLKVEGYLEDRAGMEEGTTNKYLIVTKIIGFDTNKIAPLFTE
ncbi:copper homeostasis protein [Brachyspira pilosicoli]|uniref:Copper homeostasis protein n=1 Tax=Brachyspira pilosicoli TaxID=52584 RepID=A0A5C8ET97_BRAPL|nr:copper homeostasis protein [Brachyspira pilosicoli]TXJ41065.1 copper homeostasis protein [Brachyspira pilosicoli]